MSPAERRFLLQQVRLYRLMIAPAAARLLRVPTGTAHERLEELVRLGALHRHLEGRALYYTVSPRPLLRGEIREAFAVLWFAVMGKPARELLFEREKERLAQGERGLADVLRLYPAYLEDDTLSVIVVPPGASNDSPLDLGRVLASLQRLVRRRAFKPLLTYAERSPLRLVVLVPDEATDELSVWLRLHPLVGEGEHGGIALSSVAEPLRLLRGT